MINHKKRQDKEETGIFFEKVMDLLQTGMSNADDSSRWKRTSIFLAAFILFGLAYLLFIIIRSPLFSLLGIDFSGFFTFNTIFISILMQSFPFMLIGILVSSWMHVFLSDETVIKIFPKKHGLGFLTAMFAGLCFPVCECAIVPVVTGLVKKGVPAPIAVTFMLSAPIINPIVILSTLYAFPAQPQVALFRVGFGLLIALGVGLFFTFFPGDGPVLLEGSHTCHSGCCCDAHVSEAGKDKTITQKLSAMFLHAGEEFFGVGKYLIIGACLTGLIQTLLPKEFFSSLAGQKASSLLLMMAMAFLFSVCSTSDAFIARSFINKFSMGAIMGFLVFGPMMDIKNMLMLLSGFEKKFVMKLSAAIFICNFVMLYFLTCLFF